VNSFIMRHEGCTDKREIDAKTTVIPPCYPWKLITRACAHEHFNQPKETPTQLIPPEETLSQEEANAGLLFALTAERLAAFYEHHAWLTLSQGATLAADWLARSKSHLSILQRKHLSELSDQLARQIAASVSREAGLHISYEMTEALDQRYVSETGDSMREECRRLLACSPLPDR
jgi:hypothetical protein